MRFTSQPSLSSRVLSSFLFCLLICHTTDELTHSININLSFFRTNIQMRAERKPRITSRNRILLYRFWFLLPFSVAIFVFVGYYDGVIYSFSCREIFRRDPRKSNKRYEWVIAQFKFMICNKIENWKTKTCKSHARLRTHDIFALFWICFANSHFV